MKKFSRDQLFTILLIPLLPQLSLANPLTLVAGSKTAIMPGSSRCFGREIVRAEKILSRHQFECTVNPNSARAQMLLTSAIGGLIARNDDFDVQVKMVVQFRIETFEDALRDSFLPIHIKFPVSWNGRFFNDRIDGTEGSSNFFLRIREGDDVDADNEGLLIAQTRFAGASHGGIGNCISLPTSKVAVAVMLVKCTLGLFGTDKGTGAEAELSAVIRTDQTYNLELVMLGTMVSPLLVTDLNARVDYMGTALGDEELGMFWEAPALVSIGTDAEESLAEIRDEIERLREDLERHTHIFLTGRGAGHNNTEAVTSSALIPQDEAADDMDGVAIENDLCPGTPAGAEVDGSGCELAAFCALQERLTTCSKADWRGDEPRNPQDCRWRHNACEVR